MSMIYHHHHPAFFYRRPPSSAHPLFLGLFLKNMFFLATAWFAASIAIRMVVLTLSILFSPPVFVLLVLTFATSWWSFDALRYDHIPFPATAFGGRCQSRPCLRRGAGVVERGGRSCEVCRRGVQQQQQQQQQCQSQCRQQEQSCQKRGNESKPASSTDDSKSEERKTTTNKNMERQNKNFQPNSVFYQHITSRRRTPCFHMKQDNQQVTLSVDVPCYRVSDINITVDQDDTLTIAGEQQRQNRLLGGDAAPPSAFQRQFVLSPTTMDTNSVTANMVDSLLTIAIAKKEIPKPRLITITPNDHEAQEENAPDENNEDDSEEEEEAPEKTIVFEKDPVEYEDLLSAKKPIVVVETVNDDEDEIEESDAVEGIHDSWEDVIKA